MSGVNDVRSVLLEVNGANLGAVSAFEVTGALTAAPSDTSPGRALLHVGCRPTVALDSNDIDWSQGNAFRKTLEDGPNEITFSNSSDGQTIVVALTGSGASTEVTWPTNVRWSGGTAPTQTTSGRDVYTFVNMGDGIDASVVQNLSVPS
jgi:hypothetical protein